MWHEYIILGRAGEAEDEGGTGVSQKYQQSEPKAAEQWSSVFILIRSLIKKKGFKSGFK